MFQDVPAFQANGTIAPFRFCIPDTTADHKLLQGSVQGTLCPYVAQPAQKRPPGLTGSDITIAAEAGDNVEVRGPGQVTIVEFGASTPVGPVMTDANGRAIAWTSGNHQLGIAVEAVSNSGARALVHLMPLYH